MLSAIIVSFFLFYATFRSDRFRKAICLFVERLFDNSVFEA